MNSRPFEVVKRARIIVPEDNSFGPDKLQREALADNLTTLIGTLADAFVITLSGPYGSGKTTFVEMWRPKLHRSGFRSIYFSAWENDFAADPLVALLSELRRYTSGLKMAERKAVALGVLLDEAQDIAARVRGPIASFVGKRVLDTKAPGVADFLETAFKREVDAYQSAKDGIARFKAKLAEIALAVADDESATRGPFLIFIDELDRCRPAFAIEMLERIKHLFSVPGVVFVLAVNGEQIRADVRLVFGDSADVEGFLRRVVDLDFRLPDPDLAAYCIALALEFKLQDALSPHLTVSESPPSCVTMLGALAPIFGFTLRDVDRLFVEMSIVFRTHPSRDRQFFSDDFITFLIALRTRNRAVFEGYMIGTLSARESLDALNKLSGFSRFLLTESGTTIEGLLYAFSRFGTEASEMRSTLTERASSVQDLNEFATGRPSPAQRRTQRHLRLIEGVELREGGRYIEQLRKRLSFAELFTTAGNA